MKLSTLMIALGLLGVAQSNPLAQIHREPVNKTYYVGYSYERAYNEQYWTICTMRCFASHFKGKTRKGCHTTYKFLDKPWAGSKDHDLKFTLNPVSQENKVFWER